MTRAEEDLLVLARRGDLGDDDSRRLRELLATSPEARELYEAGRALDAEASVIAGDEVMFARIVRTVAARHHATTRPMRRWIARGALAANLLGGITVGASVLSRSSSSPAPAAAPAPAPAAPEHAPASPRIGPAAPIGVSPVPPPPPPAPETAAPPSPPATPAAHVPRDVPSAASPPGGRRPALPLEPTPAEPTAEVPAAGEPAAATPPNEPTADVAPPPPAPTAGELFAAANRARVQGNTREAIERATELENRYPASKEAISTLVTLGMLYLKTGDAAAALASFDGYRASGSSALMAEALWGKSQALGALGRAAEERTTLQQLVAGYPQSAYTHAAKNRVSALK
jgi:TolA-binding protein